MSFTNETGDMLANPAQATLLADHCTTVGRWILGSGECLFVADGGGHR